MKADTPDNNIFANNLKHKILINNPLGRFPREVILALTPIVQKRLAQSSKHQIKVIQEVIHHIDLSLGWSLVDFF